MDCRGMIPTTRPVISPRAAGTAISAEQMVSASVGMVLCGENHAAIQTGKVQAVQSSALMERVG